MESRCDRDKDGFTDAAEQAAPLSNLGASPTRPDIFVECDWFELRNAQGQLLHTHAPLITALQEVIDAFNAANVDTTFNGQTLSSGVTLHIDAGPLNASDPGRLLNIPSGQEQSDPAVEFTSLPAEFEFAPNATPQNILPIWAALSATKGAEMNKDPSIFHYSLWVHELDIDTTLLFADGLSKGIFTDDFVVCLGDEQANMPNNTRQAANFMHELGHTLNLRHGGNACANGPASYRSVMNLTFANANGVDIDCDGQGDGVVDFSRECANESNPTCPNPVWDDWNGGAMRLDYLNSPNVAAPPNAGNFCLDSGLTCP